MTCDWDELIMAADDAGTTQPAWAPGSADSSTECSRCGYQVSPSFFRVWNVEGELNGCPECLPRSIRFGEDIYGRDADDVEDFDKGQHNEKKPAGGIQREGGPCG